MVEFLVGILATAILGIALMAYALLEPTRIEAAQAGLLDADLDTAMSLYAENCSVCHGLAGEGIGPNPPLASSDLATVDSKTLEKIITRGLYGTSMPAWSKEDGGPLSDYQIQTLVSLIQYGDWQMTQDRVVNLGLAPRIPFTTEPDPAMVGQVAFLPEGELLSAGIQVYAEQCVACHGPDGLGTPLAPALNDPIVRQQSFDEIERAILNGVPGTLMASWQNALTSEQISQLMALITRWDEIPSGAIPEPEKPIPITAESLALGAQIFSTSCSNCHGPEGQGTQRAPSLNVKDYLATTNDLALQQIITLGVPGTSMPAWGDRLLESEIQAIVGFMRSWEPTAPEVATPTRSRGPWWSQKGGPPNNQTLPSGGVVPNQPTAQEPAVEIPVTQSQTSQDLSVLEPAVQEPAAQEPGSQELVATELPASLGDPPEGIAGNQTGAGNNSGEEVGGNPPWQTPSLLWWQTLDRRAYYLVGGLAMLAFGLLGFSIYHLRKISPVA